MLKAYAFLSVLFVSIAFFVSSAGANVHVGAHHNELISSSARQLVQVSDPTLVEVSNVVVSVKHVSTPARTWSCGRVEENMVGGSQRTCEWK